MKCLLFPGLDALFVTSKLKRWLDIPFIVNDFNRVSIWLGEMTQQKEDLVLFLKTTHRPHLVDFDRTLLGLTTLQVSIARLLQENGLGWDLVQGCSHGDIARSVIVGSIKFEEAIEILWSFSSLRKLLPEGMTCTVRTHSAGALTKEHLEFFENRNAPISLWSESNGTFGTDLDNLNEILKETDSLGLKINEMLKFPVHSQTLLPALDILRLYSAGWDIQAPRVPTFSSVWLKDLETADDIRLEALDSAVLPVQWTRTLSHLVEQRHVKTFINVGPSNSLISGLFKDPAFSHIQVDESWGLVCS